MPSWDQSSFAITGPNGQTLLFDLSDLPQGVTRVLKPHAGSNGTIAVQEAVNNFAKLQNFGAGILSLNISGPDPAVKVGPFPGNPYNPRLFEAIDGNGNTKVAISGTGILGASGSFQSSDGKTVTVTNGVITGIA